MASAAIAAMEFLDTPHECFENLKDYPFEPHFHAIAVGIGSTVLLELPIDHPARAIQASALGIGVLGAAIANPKAHAVIATVMVLLMILPSLTLGPGGLRP